MYSRITIRHYTYSAYVGAGVRLRSLVNAGACAVAGPSVVARVLPTGKNTPEPEPYAPYRATYLALQSGFLRRGPGCSEGKVVATVELEIGGLVSQRPVNEVAKEMESLHAAADEMKWINKPGLPDRMRFAFLTASPWKWQLVAPYKDNPGGFVNVTTGKTHPVIW